MSIELKNIAFTYGQGTAFEHCAIKNIDLKIEKNEYEGFANGFPEWTLEPPQVAVRRKK